MPQWNDFSIRTKLTVTSFLQTLLVTVLLLVVSAWMLNDAGRRALRSKGATLATLCAESTKAAVQFEDVSLLDQQFDQLLGSDSDLCIGGIFVLDPATQAPRVVSQKRAATSADLDLAAFAKVLGSELPDKKGEIRLFASLGYQGVAASVDPAKHAFLVLGLNEAQMKAQTLRKIAAMSGVGLAVLGLGLLAARRGASAMSRPLNCSRTECGRSPAVTAT